VQELTGWQAGEKSGEGEDMVVAGELSGWGVQMYGRGRGYGERPWEGLPGEKFCTTSTLD